MAMQRESAEDRIHRRRTTILYGWVIRVLTIGFWSSIGLILIGILVGQIRNQPIGDQVDPLDRVIPDALDLTAKGIVDLGILVLLLTPGATVVVSLITAISQRDRIFIIVCVILLLIVFGGIGVSLE